MSACCQRHYDATFDAKRAREELEAYLSGDIKKSSRPFLELLNTLSVDGKTILDIGGGVGGVIFELFKRGIHNATYIDISAAYMQAFKAEAARRFLSNRIQSIHGDFLDHCDKVQSVDLVLLDKVICCYADYQALVQTSVAKARRWYVYSIPRNVWWVRTVNWLEKSVDWLRGRYFRIYFHPEEKIEECLLAAGFHQKAKKIQREWQVFVFEKNEV